MLRNRSVDVHQFAMVPKASIPRSSFVIQKTHKTAFDSGYLVPIYVDEVLPGDSFNLKMSVFCRLATPIVPFMDNLRLESFFFFVPCRLVWSNWVKMMGEQANPDDSISYTVPIMDTYVGQFAVGTIWDHMGQQVAGQLDGGVNQPRLNILPLRAYNLIWNQWFRDENLQQSATVPLTDGPDNPGYYFLRRRGKRHDYFTSCLPWPQKGNAVNILPTGASAPVVFSHQNANGYYMRDASTGNVYTPVGAEGLSVSAAGRLLNDAGTVGFQVDPVGNLVADLGAATAATINQLRTAFQIQRLLERDARGGTRYVELLKSHFGVMPPDFRLQRPEYLGGGSSPVTVNPIAQTSATGATGTPQGNLAAMGVSIGHGHGFSQSFTEHGYVIGLVSVRADLTYQQGVRKMWNRSTRYDFYWPAFAMLGEQAVLQKEIYMRGVPGTGVNEDDRVFGYQERWAEYRYNPSEITGIMRSTAASTIDVWHLAQKFTGAPLLDDTFIQDTPPLSRVLAVGAGANGQQILCDAFFDIRAARPLPMYSVPGLSDHL